MAISLHSLVTIKSVFPPRTLIYGPPKMGKTTLANEFPNTVFIQTENGENTDEITTFGLLNSHAAVMEALGVLCEQEHTFQNVVIDSVDRLEELIWALVLSENKWDDVEANKFGKGAKASIPFWRQILDTLSYLRVQRGMCTTLIGHSEIDRFDDPRTSSYSRFDFRLNKWAHGMIEDEMDLIICLNQEAGVQEEKQGFGRTRAIAQGGVQRWMYLEARPSMNAGNRYSMPPKLPFVKGQGYTALAQYLPHTNGTVPENFMPKGSTVAAA
jgi:hypothetical protein